MFISVSLHRIFLAIVFIALQIVSTTFAEAGGKWMALVIGNSDYKNVSNLPNAANDAIDISAALKRVGFEVTSGFNLNYQELRLSLRDFAEAAESAEKTIIYFAGHGVEIGGLNYLIPVDARLRSDRDVEFEAIRLDALLGAVASTDGLKVILLDACRNNPFLSNMVRTSAKRSIGRGLGKIEPGGVLVGYAARSGTLALDGDGRNSPYSTALLQHIEEPGLEIGKMFRKVRDTVYDLTDGYQEPFTYGSLPGADVFLVPPLTSAPKQLTAAEAWQDFRSSSSPEALEAFAALYEGTAYAALALSTAKKLRVGVTASDAIQLPETLPDICNSPANSTEYLICRNSELVALHIEIETLVANRLEIVHGAARGQALVDQRNWRLSRDKCETDRSCIVASYRLRNIALGEFGNGVVPRALMVRSIQEELNRLSCGAGEPDGVPGNQTRRAYDLAASLQRSLDREASIEAIETLAALRGVPRGICSVLARGVNNPALIEGTWIVDENCVDENNSRQRFKLYLKHDGGGVFSGALARGGGRRALGGRVTPESLNLAHRTPEGNLQSYYFESSDDPNKLVGFNWNRCELTARKR